MRPYKRENYSPLVVYQGFRHATIIPLLNNLNPVIFSNFLTLRRKTLTHTRNGALGRVNQLSEAGTHIFVLCYQRKAVPVACKLPSMCYYSTFNRV